jgi:hypothetical protein
MGLSLWPCTRNDHRASARVGMIQHGVKQWQWWRVLKHFGGHDKRVDTNPGSGCGGIVTDINHDVYTRASHDVHPSVWSVIAEHVTS